MFNLFKKHEEKLLQENKNGKIRFTVPADSVYYDASIGDYSVSCSRHLDGSMYVEFELLHKGTTN